MAKSKGRKVMKFSVLTFVILAALILAVLWGAYSLIKSSEESGVALNGNWNYNGNEVLTIDIGDNNTYTLNLDGNKENGKIETVKYLKAEENGLVYDVTFNDGAKSYTVELTLDSSDDKVWTVEYTNKNSNQDIKLTQKSK